MRLLGPNTVGIYNLLTGLMANFAIGAHLKPVPKGKIAFISQSGAFCSDIYKFAGENNIGLNYFVGLGNQADIDIGDCIEYLAEDPHTDVILLYCEGTYDIDKLARSLNLAKKNNKIVIALKSGRSEIGKMAALAHTATTAGSNEIYDSIFNQTDVLRVNSIQDMLDIIIAYSKGIPKGDNVAIFSISGGAGVLMADQLTELEIRFTSPNQEVQKKLLELLPFASVTNPIDLTAQIVNDTSLLETFMKEVLKTGEFDMAITYLAGIGSHEPHYDKLTSALREVRKACPNIPLLMSTDYTPKFKKTLDSLGIVIYDDPIRMVKAAKALCEFSKTKYTLKEV